MKGIDLRDGEVVVEKIKGDIWERILFLHSQTRTEGIYITNQRIVVNGLLGPIKEIEYSDIVDIKLCAVGSLIKIMATGIKIFTKDGKYTMLSVLHRKDVLAKIQMVAGIQ